MINQVRNTLETKGPQTNHLADHLSILSVEAFKVLNMLDYICQLTGGVVGQPDTLF